jgi:hypothetical protein
MQQRKRQDAPNGRHCLCQDRLIAVATADGNCDLSTIGEGRAVEDPPLGYHRRQRRWDECLSAMIHADYFANLASIPWPAARLEMAHAVLTSSGGAATFLARLPSEYAWARPVLAIVTAGLSLDTVNSAQLPPI